MALPDDEWDLTSSSPWPSSDVVSEASNSVPETLSTAVPCIGNVHELLDLGLR